MVGHLADLDADFLAIYGIDLRREVMDGPRFFALAHRVTAYDGVMAARVEEERQDAEAPAQPSAAPQSAVRPAADNEISLTAFRFKFPGLVSMAVEGGG